MPKWIAEHPLSRPPNEDILEAEFERAMQPFRKKQGNLYGLREKLLDTMWDDVGVVRDAVGLERGLTVIADIEQELLETGVSDGNRAFNLTWHDWLNLRSLCETSRVITVAAQQRKNSRGAHFRSDFPTPGELATSRYTVARDVDGKLLVDDAPVEFTIVKPGESLLTDSPRAAE